MGGLFDQPHRHCPTLQQSSSEEYVTEGVDEPLSTVLCSVLLYQANRGHLSQMTVRVLATRGFVPALTMKEEFQQSFRIVADHSSPFWLCVGQA